MYQSRKPIKDLPDELHLAICEQFDSTTRNRDLLALSLVSRHWCGIAQEQLLKNPCLHIKYLLHYVAELIAQPHLLPQVRLLEIRSSSDGRIERHDNGTAVQKYVPCKGPKFIQESVNLQRVFTQVIHDNALFRQAADEWLTALEDDTLPALFAILVCILPNLKELKVGNAWLLDFPVFSKCFPGPLATGLGAAQHFVVPSAWAHDFMIGPLNRMKVQLTVLDVPAEMTAMAFPFFDNAVFDFREFLNLKELGITMAALSGGHMSISYSRPNSREVLPSSLEVLRISEAQGSTSYFVQDLCTANRAHFAKMRRLEVYCMHHVGARGSRARPSLFYWTRTPLGLVSNLRTYCKLAELELYVYHPSDRFFTWEQRATPWRLKEEGRLLKEVGAFHAEWNKDGAEVDLLDDDGDIVMVQGKSCYA